MAQLPKNFPEEYLAILQKFRFIDDTFFAACLDGDIPCMNLILRLVLARDDIEVQRVTTQQSVQNLYGRGVRFDVLAVDAAGKLYNCEVQRASEGAIPRRARYNSGMLDSRVLAKGTPVRELPETYVIFLQGRHATRAPDAGLLRAEGGASALSCPGAAYGVFQI